MNPELTIEIIQELSLAELSILFATNDGKLDGRDPNPDPDNSYELILTTKDFYFYAVLISIIINRYPTIEVDYKSVIFHAINELKDRLSEIYRRPTEFYHNNTPDREDTFMFSVIIEILRVVYQMELLDFGDINDLVKQSFESMVAKDYIVDPVFTSIGAISLAVVGFIPVGFTKKTEKGKTTLIEISSAFWKYQRKVNQEGDETIEVSLRLYKAINAFKSAFVHGIKDLILNDKK